MTRRVWAALAAALVLSFVSGRAVLAETVIKVSPDDAKVNAAMAKARATLVTFVTALRSGNAGLSDFAIKVAIHDGETTEYFWVIGVAYDGTAFHGRIGNDPESVKNVVYGQKIDVRPPEIADWMYVENGKLVGGYTVRVLRERLSPAERAEFDKSVPFKIED